MPGLEEIDRHRRPHIAESDKPDRRHYASFQFRPSRFRAGLSRDSEGQSLQTVCRRNLAPTTLPLPSPPRRPGGEGRVRGAAERVCGLAPPPTPLPGRNPPPPPPPPP